MSWTITLCFIDQINQKIHKMNQRFYPLYTYNNLYDDLQVLLKKIGWKFNCKIAVDFKTILRNGVAVAALNWNDFILDSDTIHVILYDPNQHYYVLFNQNGDILLTDKNISMIYKNLSIFKYELLFIYRLNEVQTRGKLIDVIRNDKIAYNQTVNRMIHNYYEKYKITI